MSKKGIKQTQIFVACLMLTPNPVVALDLVTRDDWAAKEPLFGLIEHTPERITLHHTATAMRPDKPLEEKLKSLQNFSQSTAKLADGRTKKAWADVPYHYYIDATGRVAEGRDPGFAGDTNTNYDPTGHISVVVEGNFEIEDLTGLQRIALVELLKLLAVRYDIQASRIGYHKSFASTLCPGVNFVKEIPGILEDIN